MLLLKTFRANPMEITSKTETIREMAKVLRIDSVTATKMMKKL